MCGNGAVCPAENEISEDQASCAFQASVSKTAGASRGPDKASDPHRVQQLLSNSADFDRNKFEAHSSHEPSSAREPTEGPAEFGEDSLARYVIIPVGIAITASLFLGGSLEKVGLSWVPESAVTLTMGLCLGFFMKYNIGYVAIFNNEEVFHETCSTLLNLFLLPPLIFESGWSLRTKDFASQFEYIMLFAIVGSLISFTAVGSAIYCTGQLGLHSIRFPRTAFAYASLISATDPVATLATYSKLKVDPLLNILVFGDSTFNDAVAIVLFKVLNDNEIMGTPGDRPSLTELAGRILKGIVRIFGGSVAVGAIVGSLFLLTLRFFHMRDEPRLEILGLLIVGYITFAVGEIVGMSGIIATVFCSIQLGIYARPHLSARGSLLGSFFLKQVATLMDTSVFLLTGVCAASLGMTGLYFGTWAMLFCIVGRAAAVFPVGFLTNFVKTRRGRARGSPEENWHLLSSEGMFMMWHAGLRGAIALTLCMQLGPWVDVLDAPGTRHILQTATFLLICVFMLVFGGSTEILLEALKVPMGDESDPEKLYRTETSGATQILLANIDRNLMAPLFIGDERAEAQIDESLKEMEVEEALKKIGL